MHATPDDRPVKTISENLFFIPGQP